MCGRTYILYFSKCWRASMMCWNICATHKQHSSLWNIMSMACGSNWLWRYFSVGFWRRFPLYQRQSFIVIEQHAVILVKRRCWLNSPQTFRIDFYWMVECALARLYVFSVIVCICVGYSRWMSRRGTSVSTRVRFNPERLQSFGKQRNGEIDRSMMWLG